MTVSEPPSDGLARRAEEAPRLLHRARVDAADEHPARAALLGVVGARQARDRVQQHDHVAPRLDEALGALEHDLGDMHVVARQLVRGRGDHLAADTAPHVGDFLGPLVDEQHDQVDLGMVRGDGVRRSSAGAPSCPPWAGRRSGSAGPCRSGAIRSTTRVDSSSPSISRRMRSLRILGDQVLEGRRPAHAPGPPVDRLGEARRALSRGDGAPADLDSALEREAGDHVARDERILGSGRSPPGRTQQPWPAPDLQDPAHFDRGSPRRARARRPYGAAVRRPAVGDGVPVDCAPVGPPDRPPPRPPCGSFCMPGARRRRRRRPPPPGGELGRPL